MCRPSMRGTAVPAVRQTAPVRPSWLQLLPEVAWQRWFLWQRVSLVVIAAIGAVLLVVIIVYSWTSVVSDGLAYWRAGERLMHGEAVYPASGAVGTPLAYWYPPPLAQALAPLAAVVPEGVFNWCWIALLVGCLWYLVDGSLLAFLAAIAFAPVAVELWVRNIHLPLAVMTVLGLRRHGWLLGLGAAIKLAPAVGIVYLAARGRWRQAVAGLAAGALVGIISLALAPGLWQTWFSTMLANGGAEGEPGLLPIPYWLRLAAAVLLALVAARLPERWGPSVAALAVVVALPTWWAAAFSSLLAVWALRPSKVSEAA